MTRVLIIAAAVLLTAVALSSAPEPDDRPWPGVPVPAAAGDSGQRAAPAAAQTAEPAVPLAGAPPFVAPESAAARGRMIAIHSADLPANEASGLAASRRHPGVFYWLRDGGGATAD